MTEQVNFLIRDHLRVKPLHYLNIGDKLYFGSDYTSLNIHSYKNKMNNSALISYLSFRYVIGKQTFYNNMFDVLPGTSVFVMKTDKGSSVLGYPRN